MFNTKLFIIIAAIVLLSSESFCQEKLNGEYRIIIKQTDNDSLWYELFHPKDFTRPKEVVCLFIPNDGLLIFPKINTAYLWEDLDKNQKELILKRTKRDSAY
jgi:hypothetical protein